MVHTVIQVLLARRRHRRRLDRPPRASESDEPPPAGKPRAAPLQGAAPRHTRALLPATRAGAPARHSRGHPCPPLARGPGPRYCGSPASRSSIVARPRSGTSSGKLASAASGAGATSSAAATAACRRTAATTSAGVAAR